MFMAIPNYVYLKLKILGPRGIITMTESLIPNAYECDRACVKHVDRILHTEAYERQLEHDQLNKQEM